VPFTLKSGLPLHFFLKYITVLLTKKNLVYIITLVFLGCKKVKIYIPDLRQKSGEAASYSFETELSKIVEDCVAGAKLNLSVNASVSGDKILIKGCFQVTTEDDCSRCLEPFMNVVEADFSEAFTVLKSYSEENCDYLASETANNLTVTGDYLYLDEYIRQQIILAQEISPVCKPDCKGLCPVCGSDLNKATCSCSSDNKTIDVRLLKLKDLSPGS
jgi:uncharacterized protein